MKKVIALVLALVMVLCATAALAEGSKKESDLNNGTVKTTTTTTAVRLEKAADTAGTKAFKQAVKDAQDAGNVMGAFPADLVSLVPAGYSTVNEMDTYKLVGDVTGVASLKLEFKFATTFGVGETVPLMIAIDKGTTTEIIYTTGTGIAGGKVEVVFDSTILAAIGNYPFVIVPISKTPNP